MLAGDTPGYIDINPAEVLTYIADDLTFAQVRRQCRTRLAACRAAKWRCGDPANSSGTPNVPLPVLHLSVCPRHPPQSAINKSANELALVTAHVARAAAAFNPDTAVCTTLALAP